MTSDAAGSALGCGSAASAQESAYAEIFGANASSALRYAQILRTRGLEWGLLGPREGERLWERHILNSLAIASLIPRRASVIDVGSGAGLPGIPLALYRPDLSVVLLDSLARRTEFLSLAVSELGLGERVSVVRSRAEEYSGSFDVVTCRAVSSLQKLISWTLPLVGRRGKLVALKGERATAELAEVKSILRRKHLAGKVVPVEVPGLDEGTWTVEIWRS